MADLRGFTRYSDEQELSVVLRDLDRWLEMMVDTVTSANGEVLKFLGDGLLAMFPVSNGGVDEASAAALRAARSALNAAAQANVGRVAEGRESYRFAMGLDAGELAYGNVGGLERLDFTVIGPVVNRASRLVELCKTLEVPLLVSERCAAGQIPPLQSLGHHELRDVLLPLHVYAP